LDLSNWPLKDSITIAIAAWGALLGTYAAVLSTVQLIQKIREKMSRLEIKMSLQISKEKNREKANIAVAALNKGEREVLLHYPIILHSWSRFRRPRKEGLVLINHADAAAYPIELKPGSSHVQLFDLAQIAKDLKNAGHSGIKKIRAQYTDGLGRCYLSDSMDFNIEQWLVRT
jgi:hypothetical protein